MTVDYATADGTATASADYTAASGTLTFAAGETSKTVSVPVLNDAHDDGGETLTLTLSNATGAYIADAEATGAIENTDPLQRAWLARFGRTVAEHVMEAVGARIEGRSPASTQLTLGGRQVLLGASRPAEGENGAIPLSCLTGANGLKPDLADADGPPRGTGDFGQGLWKEADDSPARAVSMSELLLASSFHLASADGEGKDAGARWSMWGRGSRSSFSGRDGTLTLDGGKLEGEAATRCVDVELARLVPCPPGQQVHERGGHGRERPGRKRVRSAQDVLQSLNHGSLQRAGSTTTRTQLPSR